MIALKGWGLAWLLILYAGCAQAQAQTQTQTVEYIHTDALGSVVAVTDENGNVIERREYEPFGAQLTPALQDGPGYTGHVQDAATGLTYMQQRYYDPQVGRFLSVDPVTADGNTGGNFNRYWYANNNPYRFTDPDGRQSESVMDRRYVYPALSPEQMAEVEAQHHEIGGQAFSGMMVGASLVLAPEAVLVRGGAMLAARMASGSFTRASALAERMAAGLERTGGSLGQTTLQGFPSGGRKVAESLFNGLTRGKSDPAGGGRIGALGDRSTVQMSTRTLKDGTVRTDVRISRQVTTTGSRIPKTENIKLRFDEKPK